MPAATAAAVGSAPPPPPPGDHTPRNAWERFVMVPRVLVTKYAARPIVPAVFAAIARLSEIARGPVDVSRNDLAIWCDLDRDHALGGAIERAIWDLRADGWLIQTEGEQRKRRLLPAWGLGRDGRPRPWQGGRRDRGRPEKLDFVPVPLPLFDYYLGRLVRAPDHPTYVERYFQLPLLDLHDIGVYIVRLHRNVPITPRLLCLGLVDATVRTSLDTLMAQAADGHLTTCAVDGTPVSVRLTPTTEARYRRRCAVRQGADGSPDPACPPNGSDDGSDDGSAGAATRQASERRATGDSATRRPAWDGDGINKQRTCDPPPTADIGARARRGEGNSRAHRWETAATQPERSDPSLAQQAPGAVGDSGHAFALDPAILQGHQALNADRTLPPGECWGLAQLQRQHGRAAVLRWQMRAASAGRTEVRLNYYRACAADDARRAVTSGRDCGPAPRVLAVADAGATDSPVAPDPPVAPVRRAAPRSAPRPAPLDPERARVVAAIERQLGAVVHCPHKLATAPLEVLQRWQAVADHPGLRKMADPVALFVQRAAAGKEPPPRAVLDAWARAIADESAAAARAQAVPDMAVTAQLYDALCEMLPASCHPPLASVRLQVRDQRIDLVCPDLAVFTIAWDVQEVVRDVLRDLDWLGDIRIVAPAHIRAPDPDPSHPLWIDPAIWVTLHPDLQAALLGSVLLPDGLDVRAGQYEVLTTRFVADVRALIANANRRGGSAIPQAVA